jgi:hypothetical protein
MRPAHVETKEVLTGLEAGDALDLFCWDVAILPHNDLAQIE